MYRGGGERGGGGGYGVSLDSDYKYTHVTLSIPGYLEGSMHEYQHKIPTLPQHALHNCWGPDCGAKNQRAYNEINKPILPPEDRKYIQKVVGNFINYTRAVEPTILVALGILAAAHSKVTEYTKKSVFHLLYYCAVNPYSKLKLHSRYITLHIHSDTSYLSKLHARSCEEGNCFLGTQILNNTSESNRAILALSKNHKKM